MRNLFLLCALVSILCASCGFGGKRVQGDGNIKKEQRNVSSFDKVQVSGAIDLYVSQGDAKPVEIEGDANLIPYIEIEQTGSRLVVRSKKGYNLDPTDHMKLYVTAPVYEKIEVSGACNIYSQSKINNDHNLKLGVSGAGDIKMEVDAPKISADISGAGNVDLKGETKDLDLDLTGAGKAHCYDLKSENTKVDISGAGSAEVYASQKLDAQVSGAGSVHYKGNAKDVSQHVSGAGSVSKTE